MPVRCRVAAFPPGHLLLAGGLKQSRAAEIEELLNKLADEQRVTLKLIYFHGFNYAEVAGEIRAGPSRRLKPTRKTGSHVRKYWTEKRRRRDHEPRGPSNSIRSS